ncbi:hypothetical protein SVAN01_00987 [Stagonosporopsis vannaccii]|nr:hypothetical protein SVAN01_00987 [Stagonosporopsis vannaccii]
MKYFSVFTSLVFAASAASRVILGPYQSASVTSLPSALQPRDFHAGFPNISTVVHSKHSFDPDGKWELDADPEDGVSASPVQDRSELTPEEKEAIWCKAKSRGVQLTKAMMMSDQEAATVLQWPYMQSPWDGDLREDLKKWGYRDDFEGDADIDKQCDFDKTQEMADAFKDLGVDPRSAMAGGPNHCYYVEHNDGPAVHRDENGELPYHEEQYYTADGKELRVTVAYAKVGINRADGLVYFLHRQSPEDAAFENWGYKPRADELPALRSSSDISWGMWNRVASESQKLDYFMSVSIVNPETNYIVDRIFEQQGVEEVPEWPGKDFEFAVKPSEDGERKELDLLKSEAAFALLGSPNGIAAGYFLIQHRRQLGWKHIWKARVWRAGAGVWASPNILFYVSDRNPFEGADPQQQLEQQMDDLDAAKRKRRKRDLKVTQVSSVVHTSLNGKNMIREHVIMARL